MFKKTNYRFIIFVLLLALLASCGTQAGPATEPAAAGTAQSVSASPTTPVISSSSEPAQSTPADSAIPPVPVMAPEEVVKAFYTGYIACIHGQGCTVGDYLEQASDPAEGFLSQDCIQRTESLKQQYEIDPGSRYDLFLLSQEIPQEVQVEAYAEAGEQAQVVVKPLWAGLSWQDLTVDLVQADGRWLIDRIRAGHPDTPEGAVQHFYDEYLEYARYQGNPLVDGIYKTSPYLSADFIARVDAALADKSQAGFDPLLLAQDIPAKLVFEPVSLRGDEASLVVQQYWGGNPDPTAMTISLRKLDGRWQIDGVSREVDPPVPAQVVHRFYTWLIEYSKVSPEGDIRNPVVEKAYQDSPYLSANFIRHIDEITAEPLGYDPLLCAQDVPGSIHTQGTFFSGDAASVVLRSSFPNHALVVDLSQAPGEDWKIQAIICLDSPQAIAKAFYTWYLAYAGDPANGEPRNPLVDGAYRTSGFLTEALIQNIEQAAASNVLVSDPFLLAQDLPQSFSVEAGSEEGTAIVTERFGPDSEKQLLVRLDQQGWPWKIDEIHEVTTSE